MHTVALYHCFMLLIYLFGFFMLKFSNGLNQDVMGWTYEGDKQCLQIFSNPKWNQRYCKILRWILGEADRIECVMNETSFRTSLMSSFDISNVEAVGHINPLKPKLNPICYLLALLAHHFLHVSRIRVKSLTIRLLMSYIYIWSVYSWCF